MGTRPKELAAALDSVDSEPVCVVVNGGNSPTPEQVAPHRRTLTVESNLGVPGGRDLGARSSTADIVAFLDDDATAATRSTERIRDAFAADDRLGALALRLVDEHGRTSRRHVPRFGGRSADRSGEVALFLGGACAIRRAAYEAAGGYWTELFYGHEEVELSWRLIDHGWRIRYHADATVTHPRTEIGRHAEGWEMTGRNRVLIARRTLPWPVAAVHVVSWLVLGSLRAPRGEHRRAYRRGWRSGWSVSLERRPIRWRTVWRLVRLGRPPVV